MMTLLTLLFSNIEKIKFSNSNKLIKRKFQNFEATKKPLTQTLITTKHYILAPILKLKL